MNFLSQLKCFLFLKLCQNFKLFDINGIVELHSATVYSRGISCAQESHSEFVAQIPSSCLTMILAILVIL